MVSRYFCWKDCFTLFSNKKESAMETSYLSYLQNDIDAHNCDSRYMKTVLPGSKLLICFRKPGLPGYNEGPKDVYQDRISKKEDNIDLLVLFRSPACKSKQCKRIGILGGCNQLDQGSQSLQKMRLVGKFEESSLQCLPFMSYYNLPRFV